MLTRLRETPRLLALWIVTLLVVAAVCLTIGLVLHWTSEATATLIVGAVAAYIAVPPAIEVLISPKRESKNARILHAIHAGPNEVRKTAPVLLEALEEEVHADDALEVLGTSDQLGEIRPKTRKQLQAAVASRVRCNSDDIALQVLQHLGAEDQDVDAIARALPNERALELLSRIPTQPAATALVSALQDHTDERVLHAIVTSTVNVGRSAEPDHLREALEARYLSQDPDIRQAVMEAWYRLGNIDRIAHIVTDTWLPVFGGDEGRHQLDVATAVRMLSFPRHGAPKLSDEEDRQNRETAAAALSKVLLWDRDDPRRAIVVRELAPPWDIARPPIWDVERLRRRRIEQLEQRQREIARELEGHDEWYLRSAGDEEIAALAQASLNQRVEGHESYCPSK